MPLPYTEADKSQFPIFWHWNCKPPPTDAGTTELEFPINTNVEFEVTTPEWIKRNTESRALESIPLRFTVEENSTLDVREGIIVISGEDVKQEIKVIQLGRNDSGRVAIIHNGINFNIPQIVGHNVSGTIYWGDNTQENYKENTVHTYQDDKEHQVIMEILGGEETIIINIQPQDDGSRKIQISNWNNDPIN